jgi:hypothetical protein
MSAVLWMSLGLIAVATVFAWLLALRTRKSLVALSSEPSSSPAGLSGPHRKGRALLPERYAARQVVEPSGSHTVPGLSKTEAEELLDWLEAHGVQNRELVQADEQGFTVRYW